MSIHKPHDHFVRRAMGDLELARALLRLFLSERLIKDLALEQLTLDKENYIGTELSELMTDVLFKIPYAEYPFFISILFEHKSEGAMRAGDVNLPFQLRRQEVEVMEHYRRNSEQGEMPIVLLMGFYHGKKPYRGPLKVSEKIKGPLEWMPERWDRQDMVLIDLCAYSDEQLAKGDKLGVFLLILKHIYDSDLMAVFQRLEPLLKALDASESGRDFLLSTFTYVYEVAETENREQIEGFVLKSLSEETGGLAMTIAEKLRQEGREEGVKIGREEGILVERKSTIQQLLRKGFDLAAITNMLGLSRDEVEGVLH